MGIERTHITARKLLIKKAFKITPLNFAGLFRSAS